MDIERGLLSKVISESSFTDLVEHRITPEFFTIEDNRETFVFIKGFHEKYGEVPSLEAVLLEVPDWESVKAKEPLLWYLDELRKAREYSVIYGALTDVKPLMRNGDLREAKSLLGMALSQSELEINALRDVDINESWDEWWEMYKELPEGLIGIPTGFPTIDYATGGYQPEQLIVIVGPPKAGKSTLAIALAKHANDYGLRPLFVSFEMSTDEQRMRYYAMVGKINYHDLLHRRLSEPDAKRLEKAMRMQSGMPPFVVSTDITHGTTIGALRTKIAQYRPGVVIVDGMYMMDSEVPDTHQMDTRALTALVAGMKITAQNLRIPVVVTHQAMESRYSAKAGLKSKDVGWSSAFAMYADAMFGIEPPSEEEPNARRLSIMLARHSSKKSTLIEWDWSTSTFEEMDDYMEYNPDDYMNSFDDDDDD